MAKIKYFAEYQGQPVELVGVVHNGGYFYKASSFEGRAPDGTRLVAQRMVNMKPNPSRHDCDSRCIFATGRIMRCECSCGGKNHGRGYFSCEATSMTNPTTEKGADNKPQLVLPGAEQNPAGLAALKINQPLKPKKAQDLDTSALPLFGDSAKQKELF